MEGNNWQNKPYYSKERRFNNRRIHRPYSHSRSNVNQDLPAPYPDNLSSVQNQPYNGNRTSPHSAYLGESSYSKREGRNTEGECFKTNFYQRRRLPYDRQRSQSNRNPTNRDSFAPPYEQTSRPSTSSGLPVIEMSPEEAKALRLMNTVKTQDGVNGLLVLIQSDGDNSVSVLQSAVQATKDVVLTVVPGNKPQSYELKINSECIAEGEYPNVKIAKNELSELALDKLKKTCFFIAKKKSYEEISTEDLNKPKTGTATSNKMEGSKAHLMMLKMGWGGKGLGVNEQGAEKTVAETITQNITKAGLGGKDIMGQINKILEEFARSTKISTLAFDSGFSKEERAHIHKLAAKLNLKSKSEGKEENRRITIAKKISRWDLVKELLLVNCENNSYKLSIPSNFESLWLDE